MNRPTKDSKRAAADDLYKALKKAIPYLKDSADTWDGRAANSEQHAVRSDLAFPKEAKAAAAKTRARHRKALETLTEAQNALNKARP